uniref:Uncharacterized protein n=1 Tax=Ceratitis capitata TaxID=7213 RepID=W8BC79_CERCA
MFLTRMVSGFICAKNSKNANNQQQQQQHTPNQQQAQQPKSPSLHKKTEKCKRSLSKTDSKKSISELLKTHSKETTERPSTSKNYNNNNGGNNSSTKVTPNTSKSTIKPPTKVKSGSWKRSEKQITNYNGISVAGKKSKTLRKRSPTWLKFPNTPVKIADKVTYVSPVDSTSVCRPGTLYSDVLFGAGSSCLVKIKTLTPRRTANTAQKKLTKALLRCNGTENETASASETKADREFFPSLNGITATATVAGAASTMSPDSSPRNRSATGSPMSASTTSDLTIPTNASKSTLNDATLPQVVRLPKCDDDADVVILSEANGICGAAGNSFSDISYGNYLEHHFKQINGTAGASLGPKSIVPNLDVVANGACVDGTTGDTDNSLQPDVVLSGFPHLTTKPFTIDIPQWNFLDADVSADAYPKFLCQFDDEHYLKAEKMALLGLKLALGNGNTNPQQVNFKF